MGAVDQSERDQAIRVLLACRELFTDEELQENLAGLDAQCGGVMAAWHPPWVDQGIEEMNFNEEMLRKMPVEHWVQTFEAMLQDLLSAAEEAQLLRDEPGFVVVIPGGLETLPVIPTLTRLGGGMLLNERGKGEAPSTLPFSRFIFLKALEGWRHSDAGGPWNDFVKDAKLDQQATEDDCVQRSEETLRSKALLAVLNATPAAEMVPAEAPAGHVQMAGPGEDRDWTQDESAVSSAPAMLRPASLPSTIKFIHLGILQEATESHGEAAGLILAVMQLLREEEIWAKLMTLDAYCDGLLSNWKPPWEEESPSRTAPMSLELLRQEDESTVYDWAMALDGFCSFVANLAVAARIHHQVSSSTDVVVPGSSGGSCTQDADADVEAKVDAQLEQSSQAATNGVGSNVAVVVVVPDDLTEWHLEVFGPLLRAFKIFILAEQAWRRDFNAATTVPFSVEAASAMSFAG